MKIALLLSGGVDSSVALYRLLEEGYSDITAYYLKIWLEDELSFMGTCPWEEDLEYARAVCDAKSVPLKVLPLQQEYYDQVVSYTLSELKKGRTPSPDIFCNQRIKFGAFFDKVNEHYDKVATGHYAVVEEVNGLTWLHRSPDPVKDQSYFLSHLSQEQLRKIMFPIGSMMKEEVRVLAEKYDLPNKDRRDSQGICFLGKIKYSDFVKHYLGEKEGEIRELESEEVLGRHKGFWFHTIGQRQGLGLSNGPWYVTSKDLEKNIIYVSSSKNVLERKRTVFTVCEPNWISRKPSGEELSLKLRHGPHLHDCRIKWLSPDRLEVTLDEGDKGIAPGQFAVFYEDNICLGGARIE
ncbi:tRNA 2-thiouridine(34) synthase MnmA [Oceanispirochaeta sp.]|jgi:tRNA (5-methylaminomethyl-2-thiouridylate)-methyltransferase|uniref:tRNA 2-thiouridine(34) synthase MnmA n=1 Tax=Oceanispirochaeta sp. TaxID=2035350 RepID=UPI002607DEAF|nr:tRNA 2-thiouridine(34) synthase MnmA [Oceanispirochaeta sp.]MDA3956465.1 tRNA 2-thiouridine(34) synthase MnmA [Oceanispirochaeta sp.]